MKNLWIPLTEWLDKRNSVITEDWAGNTPKNCDVCKTEIKGHFVDGKTRMGPWANMCTSCHKKLGVGLGTGKGQKYEADSGKKVDG